ncbi:MAG: HpcH/HpaI aldolase/citrate lyase family protein [Thermoplasmatota archaeon]
MRCRSLLYTPGDRPERLEKALKAGVADIVCADLEDGVRPAAKRDARTATARVLGATPSAALRAVRIQKWPSPEAEADLEAVVGARPDLIVVPKVEEVDAVMRLDSRLNASPARLVLIVETARGVLEAPRLAAAPRVAAVCFGAEDLCADLGIPRSADNREVASARSWVVLAAAAAGIPALDMITADVRDVERVGREAAEARRLGFRGKMCIHPTQVPAIHEAFRPTPAEIEWATKVEAAARGADLGEGGVLEVEGRMVDVPVVRQARKILEDAKP